MFLVIKIKYNDRTYIEEILISIFLCLKQFNFIGSKIPAFWNFDLDKLVNKQTKQIFYITKFKNLKENLQQNLSKLFKNFYR